MLKTTSFYSNVDLEVQPERKRKKVRPKIPPIKISKPKQVKQLWCLSNVGSTGDKLKGLKKGPYLGACRCAPQFAYPICGPMR